MNENEFISLHEIESARTYWHNKLSGELHEVRLPVDYPAGPPYEAAHYRCTLNSELTEKILYRAMHNPLALYVILLTALKILLFKYLGQEDIIAASPVYDETRRKYNKYVLFRDILQPRLNFKELLMQVKETVLQGYQNDYFHHKNLFKVFSISPGRVILLLENIHKKEWAADIRNDYENDITIAVKEDNKILEMDIIYNGSAFKPGTVTRFIDFYLHILHQVLNDTQQPLNQLELIPGAEKLRLLQEFNNTRQAFPGDKTIQQCFQDQVEKSPQKIAVSWLLDTAALPGNRTAAPREKQMSKEKLPSQDLSYRQLDDRANRAAELLGKKSVGADDIVGLLLESSLEMVISILGVLKTGAAYLPIDPQWPLERKKHIFQNCGLKFLLTQPYPDSQELSTLIPPETLICIDTDKLPPPGQPGTNPAGSPNHLAYVIYTSGTAGKPKGVLINHKGLVNYTYWRINTYHLTENDITLELLTYSFDGFASNFYSALLSGGRLIMIPDPRRRDPDFIKEVARSYGVTNTSLVPGLYQLLLEETGPLNLPALRFVVLAGEKSSEALVIKSREQAPRVRLINEYGPTEITVTALARLDIDAANTAVMGKPIANTNIYILNPYLELTPVGVPGELCISGPGLARGYLNQPELTAEKFIENYFYRSYRSNRTHIKLYRTGDLARWQPDGSIEFLGRVDHQLKISGYRVEPGEIETLLLKFNGVKAAAVVAAQDENSENQQTLYAYIVVDETEPGTITDREADAAAIKNHLATHLPQYMIPSMIIPIDTLPLTPSGKIDREALARKKPDLEIQYTEPETDLEQIIADTWKEVLQLKKVGVNQNFFDIGGNSVKMLKVSTLLKNKLQMDLPVMALFEQTTIRSFSEFLQQNLAGAGTTQKQGEPGDQQQQRGQGLNMLQETLKIIDTRKT